MSSRIEQWNVFVCLHGCTTTQSAPVCVRAGSLEKSRDNGRSPPLPTSPKASLNVSRIRGPVCPFWRLMFRGDKRKPNTLQGILFYKAPTKLCGRSHGLDLPSGYRKGDSDVRGFGTPKLCGALVRGSQAVKSSWHLKRSR